ncbi:tol-pal system protein YbgF [Solemya velesiana gill symbiont]|uniref:Cell division coordinator CpoB n=1 Tax=Solemya velesiana gill symbiont TaxID=1918948 RepID=A0A1T2KTI7_9GAMM|nr:tol-pal system protein YbgF [Solemya velesiana gill symbiont]OOZ36111.1 tol-pal system protein YbgF [Solemya velesiana gill symbiont]
MQMKATVGLAVSLLLCSSAQVLAADAVLPMEQRVQVLERKVKAMSSLILRLDALQREVQQLRGEVELQNHAMDALKKRQRDLYLDVDQRLSRVAAGQQAGPAATPEAAPVMTPGSVAPASAQVPRPAPVAPTQTAAPSVPVTVASAAAPQVGTGDPAKEESAYQAAFELLMQRRYAEAHASFTGFLAAYLSGRFTDNAQYWLAEASYVTRNFDVALVDFAKVIENHPQSPKVPDALLKTGFIQYELKQWPEARATLEGLIGKHPSSTASRLAKRRLQRMQSEGH